MLHILDKYQVFHTCMLIGETSIIMLIVVMMGKWAHVSACRVVHDARLYSVSDTVVISGEDVCCSVVFDALVGVFVFSVM